MKALLDSSRCKKSALVAGLDPAPNHFPPEFETLAEHEAVRAFCLGILEAVEPYVAAVKLQSAFFERLGATGTEVYAELLDAASELGLPTIADVKRGDIGSTATAYAEAHLRTFGATCVTVNPYMGAEAVEPFLQESRKLDRGGGAFVLTATSNPSSAVFQDSTSPPLYEISASLISALSHKSPDGVQDGTPDIGAVVGATRPDIGARVRELLPETLFLAPGYGAQGAAASSVAALLDERGGGVLASSSRGLLYAYEDTGSNYKDAAREAAKRARDDLGTVIGAKP